MPRSEGLPPQRASGARKDVPNPLKFPTTSERDTEANVDEYLLDDDSMAGPPRSGTSIIRRANLPVPRTSAPPSTPVPQRRTGGQPAQPTSAFVGPYTTQPHPRNMTKHVH